MQMITDIISRHSKEFIVGLDIGSSSIKLAQFIKTQDGLHLVKADLKEISSIDNKDADEKEKLSLVKELIRGIDIKKSKFIVTVNCPKTAIRRIIAPYMPKGELRDGIRLEARNYFPFPIDESLLDFEILGEAVEKGVKKYQILVATSPKKTIDEYLSLLGKVGIKPASFIPTPYALQKLVQSLYSKEVQSKCFIEIGSRCTELAIFEGSVLIFSRKIPVVGSDFTKEMTGVLVSDRGRTELSLEEAEKIKREIGVPPEGESKMIGDKISTTQILSMIRSPLEQLVNEIDRCFDYYREETNGGRIDGLVLLGGGASLKGLAKFLSDGLGVEVRPWDPLKNLKAESGVLKGLDLMRMGGAQRLSLAIGAALSEAKGINLLPPEIKEETQRTFKRATLQAIVTGIVLFLSFIYIGMKIQFINFQKRIAASRMEFLSLQPQLKEAKVQSLINEILVDEPYWEDVFKELTNIIPDDIYLTEISMEKKLIKMEGMVFSEHREEILSDFIIKLEKGIFRNVKLIRTKEIAGQASNEFELNCWVD